MRASFPGAIVLVLLWAATAAAQGFYYKEVPKDGRIYVFNHAANAERFDKGEAIAGAITMERAGPNGETVVGDSERALQLFFFKHGIARAVPEKPAAAAAAPPYKFSGLMFGDYYGFARHHLSQWDDQHGFWLRRIYFTYDHTFSPKLSTRFRIEANSNGKLQGGALDPYVKDAYLRWNAFGRQALFLGIQPSLSFDFVESVWGLRHIEKTPLDLYRWDSSRDFGASVTGPLNSAQTIKYAVQFGNDSGNASEIDDLKGYRASLRYEMNPGFTLEGVVGQFNRKGDADRTLAQVFGAYRGARGRVGLQYSFQKRRAPEGAAARDTNLDILSGFAVFDLQPKKTSAFLRVDRHADPCADCAGIDYLPIDTKAAFTTTIAGLEFFVVPSVRFSPNVQWVTYSTPSAAGAARPSDDTVFRMTFYWAW